MTLAIYTRGTCLLWNMSSFLFNMIMISSTLNISLYIWEYYTFWEFILKQQNVPTIFLFFSASKNLLQLHYLCLIFMEMNNHRNHLKKLRYTLNICKICNLTACHKNKSCYLKITLRFLYIKIVSFGFKT